MHLKIAIISVLVLVYSCSMQPDWIENTTSNQDYWIGIGMINKPFKGDIREAARNQAIKEIASQIQINISSEMTRVIEENNYNINDFTKSIIETRLENSFTHLEFAESYQDNESYYTLVKLSKHKYYDELRKKKENEINLAVKLIEKSDEHFSINSILLLQQALNKIIKYIDEPIIINYPRNSKNSSNLYSLIKTKIISGIENINISSNPEKINIRSGWIDSDNKVIISSKDKKTGNSISNIPILIMGENSKILEKTTTNNEGLSEYVLSPENNSTDYTYTIELKLDASELSLPDSFSNLNKTQIIVNQIPLKVHIHTIEKNLGNPLEFDLAAPSIKEYLSKNIFVEFSPEKSADLVIQFSVNTSKKGDVPNEYGIYQTFGVGTLSVYDPKTNLELFSMASDNIYGSHFSSNVESGINTIEKIIDKLINDNAKNMVEVLAGSKKK